MKLYDRGVQFYLPPYIFFEHSPFFPCGNTGPNRKSYQVYCFVVPIISLLVSKARPSANSSFNAQIHSLLYKPESSVFLPSAQQVKVEIPQSFTTLIPMCIDFISQYYDRSPNKLLPSKSHGILLIFPEEKLFCPQEKIFIRKKILSFRTKYLYQKR